MAAHNSLFARHTNPQYKANPESLRDKRAAIANTQQAVLNFEALKSNY